MRIDSETITTMTEANQNFSKVAKVAENNGKAVIFKNNKPKFLFRPYGRGKNRYSRKKGFEKIQACP